MTALRKRMQQDMILFGLASSTQDRYLESVAKLAGYYRKAPDILTNEEIRNYLLSLKKRI